MTLSVFDGKSGEPRPVTNRVSNAPHWGIYHRACRERPDIVERMYQRIREAVTSDRYLEDNGSIPNSTWLGSEILRSWEYGSDWNSFCDDEDASSALFGQIMWTVMCDDERPWCTTKTTSANPNREERVYFLLPNE